MNISVVDDRLSKLQTGDIFEYGATKGKPQREHNFYMVCESESEGYFLMSLTGKKYRLKFYDTLSSLIQNQENIIKVYSKKEYAIRIVKT